jgi:hypothetical protein
LAVYNEPPGPNRLAHPVNLGGLPRLPRSKKKIFETGLTIAAAGVEYTASTEEAQPRGSREVKKVLDLENWEG